MFLILRTSKYTYKLCNMSSQSYSGVNNMGVITSWPKLKAEEQQWTPPTNCYLMAYQDYIPKNLISPVLWTFDAARPDLYNYFIVNNHRHQVSTAVCQVTLRLGVTFPS